MECEECIHSSAKFGHEALREVPRPTACAHLRKSVMNQNMTEEELEERSTKKMVIFTTANLQNLSK
jgi:hypothetical protein